MILWWQNVRLLLLLSYCGAQFPLPHILNHTPHRSGYQFWLVACLFCMWSCWYILYTYYTTTSCNNTLQLLLFLKNQLQYVCSMDITCWRLFYYFFHSILQWLHFLCNDLSGTTMEKTEKRQPKTEEYCLDNVRAIVMIALNSNKMVCNRVHLLCVHGHVHTSASKCHAVWSCVHKLTPTQTKLKSTEPVMMPMQWMLIESNENKSLSTSIVFPLLHRYIMFIFFHLTYSCFFFLFHFKRIP